MPPGFQSRFGITTSCPSVNVRAPEYASTLHAFAALPRYRAASASAVSPRLANVTMNSSDSKASGRTSGTTGRTAGGGDGAGAGIAATAGGCGGRRGAAGSGRLGVVATGGGAGALDAHAPAPRTTALSRRAIVPRRARARRHDPDVSDQPSMETQSLYHTGRSS